MNDAGGVGVRSFHASRLRKAHNCEEVAAVCYRISPEGVEFLLVQTRRGRWTFPKGGVETGLTHAQAAAREAFEEAGVHGRMEEAVFTCYRRRKITVNAYLCEVLRLDAPQEPGRHRTWFGAGEAKRRLQQGRSLEDGAEFARVVDLAVTRILRLADATSSAPPEARDAMQEVKFEAARVRARLEQAAFLRYTRREGLAGGTSEIELAVKAYLSKVLRLESGPSVAGNPALMAISARKRLSSGQMPPKVEFIDGAGGESRLRKSQK